MIPSWKIKRELGRLKVQASAIPLAIYEPLLQRGYDKKRPEHIKCTQGTLPASDNIVIFVLYQPNGVPKSVFDTCNHLISSGYSPIIMSNSPLPDLDRVALKAVAHLVAERPNFGYDFGAYRDGLWLISEHNIKPNQILFLNDSVWFPILGTSNLLNEISSSSADYVGTQVFGGPEHSSVNKMMFGSYCFAVKFPLLAHDNFLDFWSNYRLSSNKEVTLRRGERSFSRQMLKSAKRPYGIYSLDRFHTAVERLDNDHMREALGDMIALDPLLEAHRTKLLTKKTAGNWLDDGILLLKEGAKSKNYIGSSPIISIREMGFPMIKKNNERLYTLARRRICLAVSEGRLPGFDQKVYEELQSK